MEANQDEPKSLLPGLRQHHVVEVYNPLEKDFTWQVARSVVELDPRYIDPVMKQLNMRNPDHPTMKHVTQKITVPAKSTMKLPGDVAQTLVKHLIDELMNQAGHKQNIGDPTLRLSFEEQVVKNTSDLRSRLSTQSIQDQLDQQIRDLNREESIEEQKDAAEQAFPELRNSATEAGTPKPRGRKPNTAAVNS